MNRLHFASLTTWVIALAAVAVGIAIGIGLGIAGIGTSAPAGAVRFDTDTKTVEPSDWPTNEAGQTYGLVGDQSQSMPDLVQAYGDDGTIGYVRSAELGVEAPDSALDVERANQRADEAYVISLYDSDGVTVIGTFTVNKDVTTESR